MLGELFLVPVLNNQSFYNIRGTNSNLKYIKGANMAVWYIWKFLGKTQNSSSGKGKTKACLF